jgi:hypothetical protein
MRSSVAAVFGLVGAAGLLSLVAAGIVLWVETGRWPGRGGGTISLDVVSRRRRPPTATCRRCGARAWMQAGAVVARPEAAGDADVWASSCPGCWTPGGEPAALPATRWTLEPEAVVAATAAWRTWPAAAFAESPDAAFDLGACVRCSPGTEALALATPAALAPWLARHQTGDYGAYACLDADLDWLGQMNLVSLERNAGLVYSEYVVDGARVWIATELGGDTAVE